MGFLLLLVLGTTAFGQVRRITGTVTDASSGGTLPGVSIVVKGTTTGTVTDINGRYELNADGNATLVFSFIGMVTREVPVDNRNVVNVTLESDMVGLQEFVVVAYGIQRREATTGSMGVVTGEKVIDVPETSIDRMLAGKVPGLVVASASGQPGGVDQVRIRGNSSIFAGNAPLYVIDGVPVMTGDPTYFTNTGNTLASLNAADIESISVLKDAAAAAIYGSRAANGVILITTKSGKAGASKMNIRVSGGGEILANDNNFGTMEVPDYLNYVRDAVRNAGRNPDDPSNARYYFPMSLLDGPISDWWGEMNRMGKMFNSEISFEGGNENTMHYFSGGYEKHEGIFLGVDYTKIQARSNVDHRINNWLKMGSRINASRSVTNDVAMQSLYYVNPIFAGLMLSPFRPIRNEDGSYFLNISEWANTNPLASMEFDEQWEIQMRTQGSIYLDAKLFEGLTFRSTNGFEFAGGEGRRYWSPQADPTVDLGTLQTSKTKYEQWTTSNVLTFVKSFNTHNLQVIGGQEAMRYYYNSHYIYSPDVDPNIPYPTTAPAGTDYGSYGETAYSLLSFFALANYNFDERYFLQGSFRRDGSSRFGSANRWGNFWSVGASWNIHHEGFMSGVNFVNQLKLRASYGTSGNFEIGNYDQYGLYGTVSYNNYIGFAPSQPANPDLGWETNREYNFGLDYALFRKFTGSFDYYERYTEDMLLNYPLSRTSGFSSIRTNIGSLVNRGFEFMLNWNAVSTPDLQFNFGVNFAHNRSEILDLGKDEQFISTANSRILHKVGESLYSFYLYDYAGVNPANGEALWYTAGPDNERGPLTNSYAAARRFIAGSPEPKFTGGINPSFSWKGITLDMTMAFKLGHQVLVEEMRYLNSDGNFWLRNVVNTGLDYWKEPGDITQNPKPIADNSTSSYGYNNTRWMWDGDYLRISNITLSYSLPSKFTNLVGLSTLRVYASASNLYTFHDVDYFDPERGVDGTGFGIYPQTKKIVFGLNLSL